MTAARSESRLRILLEPVLCIGSGVGVFLLLHYFWRDWVLLAVAITFVLVGLAQVPPRLPALLKSVIVWMTAGVALEFLLFIAL